MRVAVIGSRGLYVENIGTYLPKETTEIVSGGARGVDRAAAIYAKQHEIPLTEFLPDYARYKRGAPLKRNEQIAIYAEMAIAFWDGKSKGTMNTVMLFRDKGKPVLLVRIHQEKSN